MIDSESLLLHDGVVYDLKGFGGFIKFAAFISSFAAAFFSSVDFFEERSSVNEALSIAYRAVSSLHPFIRNGDEAAFSRRELHIKLFL